MSVRIYCDQNFLIDIGKNCKRNKDYNKRLLQCIESGEIEFVLSAYQWVETARGNNPGAGLALAEFADSIQPKWIHERRVLQRHEVEAAFFIWCGIPYQLPSPLGTLTEVVAKLNAVSSTMVEGQSLKAKDFVQHLQSDPNAMGSLEASYEEIKNLSNGMKELAKHGKLKPEYVKLANQQYIHSLVPSLTPEGLTIAESTKGEFVSAVGINCLPCIAVDFALEEDGWVRTTQFTWSDFVDQQHVVGALPYADCFGTRDKNLTGMILRIRPKLTFQTACPITKERFDELL